VTPDTAEGRTALLAIALDTARQAGELVKKGHRTHPKIAHKGTVDLVTPYDVASERFIKDALSRKTPFGVVGEEQGGKVETATWYVDPIDGTTNFVHGHPFYCVSIGLVVAGRPVLGAVVAPSLAIEWSGGVGLGATRNGEPCTVSGAVALEDALLATGFPYDRKTSPDNNFDAFVAIKQRCQAVRRCGAAAIDLCFVADSTYDGYWERKLKPWDLAAGVAIVEAAGGQVSGFDGGLPDVITGNIIASNGAIHAVLVAELGRVPSIRGDAIRHGQG
jgi:myo-inositol-1(or 4)-monophosphatase